MAHDCDVHGEDAQIRSTARAAGEPLTPPRAAEEIRAQGEGPTRDVLLHENNALRAERDTALDTLAALQNGSRAAALEGALRALVAAVDKADLSCEVMAVGWCGKCGSCLTLGPRNNAEKLLAESSPKDRGQPYPPASDRRI